MDIDRLIGSPGVRLTTIGAALLLTTAVVLRQFSVAPWRGSTSYLVLCIVGVIAFIGLVHSFRRLYNWWLAFAEFLQSVMIVVLFGGCYLLIVPWFYLIMLLRSRGYRANSFWIPRRRIECDESYFTRMG